MGTLRIKFIWGASRVIRARWRAGLYGFYERVPGVPDGGLAISVRGLLAWSAVAVGLAYAAAATALFGVWRQNPDYHLTYTDALLYPMRRHAIAEKKGRALLARGSALLAEKRYAEAVSFLRLGLARYPRDRPARQKLAWFYLMANQRGLALRVLEEGLQEEYPGRSYLESLFEIAEQGEAHALVATVATRYIDAAAADRAWLEGRKFAALLAAGDATAALKFAESLPRDERALEHRVFALLALERATEALASIEEWRQHPGADLRTLARLRARVFRELERPEEMDSALAEWRAASPAEPGALAYAVVQRAMAKRADAAAAALEDYLFRFGGSQANLLLVAEPLAEIMDLPLLQTCAAAAAERGYPIERFDLLVAQVQIGRGEWNEAATILRRGARESGHVPATVGVMREWLQQLAEALNSPSDTAQLALLQLLRSRAWPLRIFRQSIDALLLAGRLETARDAAGAARRVFPENAWVIGKEAEIRGRLEALPPKPAGASEPTAVVLEANFFSRLDESVRQRNWEEVDAAVRDLRATRPAPEWIELRESDLRLVQVRSQQGRAEVGGMVTAVRLYLRGNETNAERLVDLAREFADGGDRAAAITVTMEVLRRFPTLQRAVEQLAGWEPPPALPKTETL